MPRPTCLAYLRCPFRASCPPPCCWPSSPPATRCRPGSTPRPNRARTMPPYPRRRGGGWRQRQPQRRGLDADLGRVPPDRRPDLARRAGAAGQGDQDAGLGRADPGRARPMPATGLPPAIIVDIDETMLDNSPYQARLIRDGKAYDEFTWDAVGAAKQAARPMPGALEFARAAAARGVTIYLPVQPRRGPGRGHARQPAQGRLPDQGRQPVPRPGHRGRRLRERRLREGLPSPAGRPQPPRADAVRRPARRLRRRSSPTPRPAASRRCGPYLGWVGERWFVLPNPSYGSWEPALFNNDWSLPEPSAAPQARRAAY